MDKPELTPLLILRAADIFVSPDDDVIAIPDFDQSPFPVTYIEYSPASAAIAALLESDIDGSVLYEYPELIDEIENEIRVIVEDWHEIYISRMRKARILNSYDGWHAFNPN